MLIAVASKDGREIKVLDLAAQDYRVSAGQVDPEVQQILKIRNPAEKFAKLHASDNVQASFLWAIFRDVFQFPHPELVVFSTPSETMRPKNPRDRLHQRGFSDAVPSKKGHTLSFFELEVHVVKKRRASVSQSDVLQTDQCHVLLSLK